MQKFQSLLAVIIVTLLLFWIYDFSCNKLKEALKNIPCFVSLLSVYGAIFVYMFKPKTKKEIDIKKDLEKINENIVLPKKETLLNLKEIEEIHSSNEGRSKILEYVKKEQYELAISKIYEDIRKNKEKKGDAREEFILRYFLYVVYSFFEKDVSKKDVEENLILFIPLAKEYADDDPYLYLEVTSDLIMLYVLQNKFEDVKKYTHPIIVEIKNDYKIPSKIKLKYYSFQAIVYLQENNIPYAMGYFEKASKYDERSDALLNMALVYYYTENNIEKCLECIEKINMSSVEEDKFNLIVRIKYYCLALQKKYNEAYEIICNYSFSEKEYSSAIKAHKAYLAYKTGNLKEAKTLSDDILKNEFETTALNVRAILQLENGEYELCIKNFDKIMPDFNETKGERFYLGEIYYHKSFANLKLKNIKEAKEDFENAKNCGFFDFDPEYIVDLDIAYQEFLNNQNK